MTDLILLIFGYMTGWFVLATILKNNSIVDIAWGLGFIVIALFTWFEGNKSVPSTYITILTTLWGLRLAIHIFTRNFGRGEDFRYKNWRDSWGKWFYPRSFLQIFMFQGLLMLLIATPIIYTNTYTSGPKEGPMLYLMLFGGSVFFFGFLTEMIADYQLRKFKKNPKNKGKIMKEGLWAASRHPNYFGEILVWWGMFIVAAACGGYITLISPVLITFLLVRVSGVTMLEKKYKDNKEYQQYIKNTPALVPWTRKK
jgi:steroid 5-alpha reductase family enzyme